MANEHLLAARELVPDWADKDDQWVQQELMRIGLVWLRLRPAIKEAQPQRTVERLARLANALTLLADVRVTENDHG